MKIDAKNAKRYAEIKEQIDLLIYQHDSVQKKFDSSKKAVIGFVGDKGTRSYESGSPVEYHHDLSKRLPVDLIVAHIKSEIAKEIDSLNEDLRLMEHPEPPQ